MMRIALAVGDRELAENAVADTNRRAELSRGVPSLAAIAAHAGGLLDGDIDKLSEAVGLFRRSPRTLAHAAAWEDLGVAHQQRRILCEHMAGLVEFHLCAIDLARGNQRLRFGPCLGKAPFDQ